MALSGRVSRDRVAGRARNVAALASSRARPWARRLRPVLPLAGWLALLTLVALAASWWLPSLLTRRPVVGGADRHTAINAARTGLAAVLAAVGGVAGLLYTARTYRLTHRGQIAERYTKALDQLAHGGSSVRTGALYALERISQENPDGYQRSVLEVLSAYVRDRAPWPTQPDPSASSSRDETPAATARWQRDVHIALTVLLNIATKAGLKNLDLSRINLTQASFQDRYLVDVKLQDSNLCDAKFNNADLRGADFTGSLLNERTSFYRADLDAAIGLESADPKLFAKAVRAPRSNA